MARDRPWRFLGDDFVPAPYKQLSQFPVFMQNFLLEVNISLLHDFFVPARPLKRSEREAAGGGVIERDPDAPQIHRGSIFFLMVFSQHGSLVHVRVLHRKHTNKRSTTRQQEV